MDFRTLETFVWIARLGSFRAAAQRLYASQPSVSSRIANLERQLGVALFERAGRGALRILRAELVPPELAFHVAYTDTAEFTVSRAVADLAIRIARENGSDRNS